MRRDYRTTPYRNMSRWEGLVIAFAEFAQGLLGILLVPIRRWPPSLGLAAAMWVGRNRMKREEAAEAATQRD